MDINHPPAEPGDHGGGDQLQVAGQDDQVGVGERGEQLGRVAGVAQDRGRDAASTGAIQCARPCPIRYHAGDLRAVPLPAPGSRLPFQRVEQRLQVGPAARDEDGDADRRHPPRLQRASDLGFDPLVTLIENAPVAYFPCVLTTSS